MIVNDSQDLARAEYCRARRVMLQAFARWLENGADISGARAEVVDMSNAAGRIINVLEIGHV